MKSTKLKGKWTSVTTNLIFILFVSTAIKYYWLITLHGMYVVLHVVCLDVFCEDVSQFNSNNVNIAVRSSSTQPVRSCLLCLLMRKKLSTLLSQKQLINQSISWLTKNNSKTTRQLWILGNYDGHVFAILLHITDVMIIDHDELINRLTNYCKNR